MIARIDSRIGRNANFAPDAMLSLLLRLAGVFISVLLLGFPNGSTEIYCRAFRISGESNKLRMIFLTAGGSAVEA